MTEVRIDLRKPARDGVDVPAEGVVEWRPTARRDVADHVTLPTPFTVPLVNGKAVVEVAPTGPDWCWKAVERTLVGGITRHVLVPAQGPTRYQDLADVDPATLDPAAQPEAAWWAALENAAIGGGVIDTAPLDTAVTAAQAAATAAAAARVGAEAARDETIFVRDEVETMIGQFPPGGGEVPKAGLMTLGALWGIFIPQGGTVPQDLPDNTLVVRQQAGGQITISLPTQTTDPEEPEEPEPVDPAEGALSVFGTGSPAGTTTTAVYTDGGGSLRYGNRFYADQVVHIVGARIWRPTGEAAFNNLGGTVYLYGQDWVGADAKYSEMGQPLALKSFDGVSAPGWQDIAFPQPVTFPAINSGVRQVDLATVAIQMADGSSYAFCTPLPPDNAIGDGAVRFAENANVGRGVASVVPTDPLNTVYGVDVLYKIGPAPEPVPGDVKPVGHDNLNATLSFFDEFDGNSLDSSKWSPWYADTPFWNTTSPGGHRTNSNEPQGYDETGISFHDGNIRFTYHQSNRAVPELEYTSGMISSAGKFEQTYGYFECRMKTPAADGAWPAFWLFPAADAWDYEIDIVEVWSKSAWNRQSVHTVHPKDGNTPPSVQYGYADDVDRDYHVYGCLWEPNRIRMYVDGQVVFDRDSSQMDIYNKPMYIHCNLAGDKDNKAAAAASAPFHMDVDYIRVWALNG